MALREGYMVTVRMDDVHPKLGEKYPLLPDDLIIREDEGTWFKECPGLAIGGFVLTEEQEATLKPVKFRNVGLDYKVVDE